MMVPFASLLPKESSWYRQFLRSQKRKSYRYELLERKPGVVNLAGKVKNLILVTLDVYRLENKKI